MENNKNNPLPSLPPCESLVSVKENSNKKRSKKERKTKNTDRKQTKLNAPHVMLMLKYYSYN